MKDQQDLLKSNLDSLKDESLDIDLSVCATIPIATSENDCSLDIYSNSHWNDNLYFFNDDTIIDGHKQNLNKKIDKNNYQQQQQLIESITQNNDQNNRCETLNNYDNNTWKCKNCDIIFFDENSLKKHLIIHRNNNKETDSRDTKCPECGKILKESSLWMHRKIHSDTKRFCCDHCGQKFVQKINFTLHMRLHAGENPYVCSQCKKTFYSSSHLLKHQKYHSNERPYKCETCGKLYKNEHSLKFHNLIHLDQKPFVCSICNKGFISSSKLKQHSNIHTGERPYKCKYCSRDFTNFPNWLKHIRRRHKVDHKTGEQLIIPSTQKMNEKLQEKEQPKQKQSSKKIYPKKVKSTSKSHKIISNQDHNNHITNELNNELMSSTKLQKTFSSSIASLTSTDDFIMEQALEMEEYYDQINSNDKTFNDGFHIRKVKNEVIQNEIDQTLLSCPEPKCDFTTDKQFLPSIDTFFTSVALQRIKNEIKQNNDSHFN